MCIRDRGMIISGYSKDTGLVECIEMKDHCCYIGSQFHPEFESTPRDPHPLFMYFIKAATPQRSSEKKTKEVEAVSA